MAYTKMAGLPGRPRIGQAAFQGPLGEAVKHLGQHSEADEAGLLFYLLSGYSAMFGRNVCVNVGTQQNHLRIWTAILGRTGIGRKGTAVREINPLLEYIDPLFMGVNVYTELTSGEGLIADWRDVYFDSDGVPQGGRADKRLLVVVEEMVQLLSAGGKLLPTLRAVWDGSNLFRITAKDGVMTVTKPHGVVHGHATPEEFALRLKRAQLAGGTYNRFLFGLVDMSKIVDFAEYDDEAAFHAKTKRLGETLKENLLKARQLGSEEKPFVLKMSSGAKKLYSEFYHKYIEETTAAETMFEQFTARLATYAHTVSGTYCLAAGKVVISEEDMSAALDVVRYSPDTIEYLYDTISGEATEEDPKKIAVFDALRRAGSAGMTNSEILKGPLMKNATKEERDAILKELKAVSRARRNPETGRTSVVSVLPEYAENSADV